MTPRTEIEEQALGLEIGNTITVMCPFCKEDWETQGKPIDWKPERSLSITKESTGLLYYCFRNSCHERGFVGGLDSTISAPKKQRQFTPKIYKYETTSPPEDLLHLVSLKPEEIEAEGILFNPWRQTYVYPIYNYNGRRIGMVDRSYSGRKPKAIAYWEEEDTKLHYPQAFKFKGDTVMVVEDIPSSIVGCRRVPTVALMGTGMNSEIVLELRKNFRNLVLALDEDAFSTALRLAKRYGLVFDRVIPILLNKDLKDMDEKEAEKILDSIKTL